MFRGLGEHVLHKLSHTLRYPRTALLHFVLHLVPLAAIVQRVSRTGGNGAGACGFDGPGGQTLHVACMLCPYSCFCVVARYSRPRFLFENVYNMDGRIAWDCLSRSPVPIPGVDILTFGWICADRASLNNNRASFKRSYESEEGKSASTFAACMRYVRKYRPSLVLAENVPGIEDGGAPARGTLTQPPPCTQRQIIQECNRVQDAHADRAPLMSPASGNTCETYCGALSRHHSISYAHFLS